MIQALMKGFLKVIVFFELPMLEVLKKRKEMNVLLTLLLCALAVPSLRAAEIESKQQAEQRAITTPRQKTLTSIPKLMKLVVDLQKNVQKSELLQPDALKNSGIHPTFSKDELLTLLVTAKSAFPQLATNEKTAPFMAKCEKLVSSLDSIVKVQGGLDILLKILVDAHTLVDDLPQFLSNGLEQSGAGEDFIKLLFSSCSPEDEQGKALKGEVMQELTDKSELTNKMVVLPKQQKNKCVIL